MIKEMIDSLIMTKKEKEKKHVILSIIRLVVFVLFLVFLFSYIFNKHILFLVLMLVTFGMFVSAVVIHSKISKALLFTKLKIEATNGYLARRGENWKGFFDEGNEFKKDSYVASDLDLFGKGSLFQYINTAKTQFGRHELADSIKSGVSKEKIIQRQKSVLSMSSNFEQVINIEGASLLFQTHKNMHSVTSLKFALDFLKKPFEFSKIWLIPTIIFPVSAIVLLVLYAISILPISPFILVVITNLFITFTYGNQRRASIASIVKMERVLEGYDEFISIVQKEVFEEENLISIKNVLSDESKKGLRKLRIIIGLISSRQNLLFLILANGIFLFDFWSFYLYSRFQRIYGESVEKWIKTIGELETLVSLTTLSFSKDVKTIPNIEESLGLSFLNLSHPLISIENAVGNGFTSGNGISIITGSNMSGKTTFMRTIGVNMSLFMAGGFVNANSFNAAIMNIFTSMRVQDDVLEGISTFYAEINRIKQMLEYLGENKPMLVLIDEIFKGTNSQDRIVGASEAIRKLMNDNVIGVVSTHDLELCQISGVANYYFEEHYQDNKIYFDYKIKEGISKTRNATYLMKIAGII